MQNTIRYADYLFMANEFNLARQEYERAIFMDSSNLHVRLNLIKTYRRLNQNEFALEKLNEFYPHKNWTSPFAREFVNLTIKSGNYNDARNHLKNNSYFSSDDLLANQVIVELFDQQYSKAKILFNQGYNSSNNYLTDLYNITNEAASLKYKKPALSLTLSVFVPGAGQLYSGYWKEAVFSFLYTSAAVFQAYRGFSKNGIKSFYGWMFTGISFGFYSGNIYGAVKSANKHNYLAKQKIQVKVENIFNNYINN
ncbi:MAG: hypothetical protein JXB17_08160 [Bacteroidales bacterium]|nr:hypothetical protein [Bacteroidales bacterium]